MAPTRKEIDNLANALGVTLLLADGFEEAFIGILMRPGDNVPVAVYDTESCEEILCVRDGMSPEESEEFLEFNVYGSYNGPTTPMFVTLAKKWEEG